MASIPGAAAAAAPAATAAAAAADVGGGPPGEPSSLELSEWDICDGCGANKVRATLPCYAIEALHAAGLIEDPLYRFNELELRGLAESAWLFACEFELPEELARHAAVDLLLDGVDTVADVTVNGHFVAQLQNAHRQYRLPVKHLLLLGQAEGGGGARATNRVQLTFHAAPGEAAARAARSPYPVPSMQGPGMLPGYNQLRKAACDCGWDWGPAFAAAGVAGSVALVGYSAPWLTGALVQQQYDAADAAAGAGGSSSAETPTARLTVNAFVQSPPPPAADAPPWRGTLSVSVAGGDPAWTVEGVPVVVGAGGETTVSATLDVRGYERWWPAGYGEQHLYEVEVRLEPQAAEEGGGSGAASGRASRVTQRIGFRQVELVREPIGSSSSGEGCSGAGGGGESFYFRVNGVPLFAKGANLIPPHVFHSQPGDAALRRLVADAAAAHMNMLRVWGGGAYPRSALLDACDELGLLVWQEAMFACSPYPGCDEAFLAEVEAELTHQARRLGSHASVAVWGGNNEVEQSLQWYAECRDAPAQYVADYAALFCSLARRVLARELGGGLVYVDGSPGNGLLSYEPGVAYSKRWTVAPAGDANDPTRGDAHFYDYGADCLDPATYPPARFVSEFGFQSFPSLRAYAQETRQEEDWDLRARMTGYRQRHPKGNEELAAQIARHFAFAAPEGGIAPDWGAMQEREQEGSAGRCSAGGPAAPPAGGEEACALFRRWVYLTQVQQALAYDTAGMRWRRARCDPGARTMGVLYWQLNEVWAGPSWSGIDAGGTSWRLLHHAARRFFDPLALSATRERGGGADADAALAFYVTNDDAAREVRGRLELQVIPLGARAEGDVLASIATGERRVAPGSTSEALRARLAHLCGGAAGAADPTALFVRAQFVPDDDGGDVAQPSSPGSGAVVHVHGALSSYAIVAPPCGLVPRAGCTADLFLCEFKDMAGLADPQLAAGSFSDASEEAGGGVGGEAGARVDFTLSCARVALCVALEAAQPGVFSDNCFTLLPWEPRRLSFFPRGMQICNRGGADALREGLTITSMFDGGAEERP